MAEARPRWSGLCHAWGMDGPAWAFVTCYFGVAAYIFVSTLTNFSLGEWLLRLW